MMPKDFLPDKGVNWLILLTAVPMLFALATCGGGGGGSDSGLDPSKTIISGVVNDGDEAAPIANANCRFIDIDGNELDSDICGDDGGFELEIPLGLQGYILCNPQSIPNLNLSTFASTLASAAGDIIPNEDVTPTTTLTADIIRYEEPADPEARKTELLHAITTGQDPNLELVATMAARLFQAMLARQVNVKFGGDRSRSGDGDGGDGEGRSDGGGVGGEAGDGADFSPLPQAQCTFLVGDSLATADPLYPSALADYWADGRLNRPDLADLEGEVQDGLEFSAEEIQQAFDRVFSQGPGQPITTLADDQGRYFLPIPAKVDGYVRCRPQGHENLVLGTYVPARQEGEIREDEDVTPATTAFGTHIAPQMAGDLATIRENYLDDMDGLITLLSGPNLPDGPLTDINLGSDTQPANSEVGLVAFSVTALFNALFKEGHDVDFLAAIADLTAQQTIDPAFLEAQGLPADQTQPLANLVNGAIGTTATALDTDLATALSTARVNVTVRTAEGGPVPEAVVDIKNALPCEGCGQATDADGQLTLILSGVSQQARRFGVTVSSVAGYEPLTVTTEVVALATVDLEVVLSSVTDYNLVVQGEGGGDGSGAVASDPAGIDCTINAAAVSGDGSAPFVGGTRVVLRATPNEDSAFGGWGGGCTGSDATCTLTMEADTTVTALFSLRCADSAYTIEDAEAPSFNAEGGDGSFDVTAPEGCPWSVLSTPDWIEITAGSGAGNGTVSYRVLANDTASARTGTIAINQEDLHTVTQDPAPCAIVISPENQDFDHTSDQGTITVTAPQGCQWTASVSSGVNWISIDAGGNGSGDGDVQYTVAENEGSARRGTITVDDQVHTVTQAPADCAYTLSPEPPTTIPAGGGSYDFTVDATHNGCGWSASEGVGWLSIETTTDAGDGTATLIIDPNPGAQRSTEVSIGFTTFQVTQAAATCSYTLSPTSANPGVAASTGTISVTPSYAGCTTSWTATSNASWVTITDGASGSGQGTVSYSVAVNNGPSRATTLTVAGNNFTVSQAAATCSYTLSPTSANPGVAASTGSISVTPSYAGCTTSWTATSNATWVTITDGASGSGQGTVSYSVAANNGPSRSTTLTVAGNNFAVSQAAAADATAPTISQISYEYYGTSSNCRTGDGETFEGEVYYVSFSYGDATGNASKSDGAYVTLTEFVGSDWQRSNRWPSEFVNQSGNGYSGELMVEYCVGYTGSIALQFTLTDGAGNTSNVLGQTVLPELP